MSAPIRVRWSAMGLDPATRAVHAGERRVSGAPSAPAIHLAATYLSAGDPAELPYAYGRHGNPTWEALEAALGELEEATALVFASGQAASFALVAALTEERPRVLFPHDGYYGTRALARMLERRGVEPAVVDLTDLGAVERELARGAAAIWAETPTNPFLRVQDLGALARLARRAGARLVVDNTTATSALQRPLELGADATVTSLTKAAAGHADVVLGSISTRDAALLERLRAWRTHAGGIAGPVEAWIALRGLRTLPLRIGRQSETALALAQRLERDPRARRVHYPGLAGACLELARAQMPRGFGPLLSFEVEGGAAAAEAVVRGSRLIRPGTSFGGVESSWERRARWKGEDAPEGLIRLSVGIEDGADLARDLDMALAALG
ncbi:MAG TPA: PLP-dependent transferase [Planctomycetota bacterium]|nr:PLP-dependent transferase [Planctomycetota bacterium]